MRGTHQAADPKLPTAGVCQTTSTSPQSVDKLSPGLQSEFEASPGNLDSSQNKKSKEGQGHNLGCASFQGAGKAGARNLSARELASMQPASPSS